MADLSNIPLQSHTMGAFNECQILRINDIDITPWSKGAKTDGPTYKFPDAHISKEAK